MARDATIDIPTFGSSRQIDVERRSAWDDRRFQTISNSQVGLEALELVEVLQSLNEFVDTHQRRGGTLHIPQDADVATCFPTG
jgi:hypothetical protein